MLYNLKQIKPLDFKGKTVLLRCDLNVPFDDNNTLLDDTRITSLLPTIKFLMEKGAKLILASHFGRPKGKPDAKLSLARLIPYLEEYCGIAVIFIADILSQESSKIIKQADGKKLLLMENLRFYKEEEDNDKEFAQQLSQLADIYINDAFSCCHRKHSSIDSITEFMPSYPGLLLEKEVKILSNVLSFNKTPFTLIIGGKKISTKISVLKSLIDKVDKIIIAGAMANNFLKALGYEIGNSFYESNFIQEAKTFYDKHKGKIMLPCDFVGKDKNNKSFTKDLSDIAEGDCILDIGVSSCEQILGIIKTSKTVIWNGPIGFYENAQYAVSSIYIARAIAYFTKHGNLTSIIGGGDAAAVAKMSGLGHYFSYISTGGGAFLEFLEKDDLIGLKNLRNE